MSTIGDAIELAAKAARLAARTGNAELKGTLAKLQATLSTLNRGTAVEPPASARPEPAPPSADLASEVVEKDGAYFKWTAEGEEDGPYCMGCHDRHGRLVRLEENERKLHRKIGKWKCPECRTNSGTR